MSNCPSDRQLVAYVYRMFDTATCTRLADHVTSCGDCRARVDEIESIGRQESGDCESYPSPGVGGETDAEALGLARGWLGRHPIIGTVGGIVVLLIVSLSIGATLFAFQLLEERQALLEAAERRSAEADLAVESFSRVLSELGGHRIERSAGFDDQARRLLEGVSNYYAELVKHDEREPDLRKVELSVQNGIIQFWLGNDIESQQALGLADTELDALIAREPDNDQYRLAVAKRHILSASMLADRRQYQSALDEYQRALQVIEQFSHPRKLEWTFARLRSQRGMARAMRESDFRGAVMLMAQASNGLEVLIATSPSQIDYQVELSAALKDLGDMQVSAGYVGNACFSYQTSVAVQRRIAKARPHADEIYLLARALAALGEAYTTIESNEASRTLLERVTVLRHLTEQDPYTRQYRMELADGHAALASSLRLEQSAEAETNYRDAIGIYELLLAEAPDDETTRLRLASATSALASLVLGESQR